MIQIVCLQKANIPGIPEEMDVRLEEAEEHIYIAMQSLQEVPLNMGLVENYLAKAEACMEEVHEKAKEMLENVLLTEKIIQYGNRYRGSHPNVHLRLLEAEEAFRQLRYAKALEDAATAVEEVEPGALKKIEVLSQRGCQAYITRQFGDFVNNILHINVNHLTIIVKVVFFRKER